MRHFMRFNRKTALSLALVFALGGSAIVFSPAPSLHLPSAAAESQKISSPVELTVYNQNFALVKDYRPLNLKGGVNTIFLDDVAALIDPTSVHFKSLTSPGSVSVLEQNFRYDLINKSNILDRMVGQKIRFKKDGIIREGVLLNPVTNYVRNSGNRYGSHYSQTSTHEFAVRTEEGVLLTTLGDVIIEELPDGLYPRPTLMWLLNNKRTGNHNTEISYLTDGVNWHCDYVAVVSQDDSKVDLVAWVTLDNRSGASYNNARLKLVAGDVRRVDPNMPQPQLKAMRSHAEADALGSGRGFSEESFFEYHLYTLQGSTDVRHNETKQLTLASADNVPIRKKYIYDPDRQNYHRWLYSGWSGNYYGSFDYYSHNTSRPGVGADTAEYKKINTLLIMENSKRHNLGIPLPKGRVRVNKADASGSLQFVGEDWIDHTPEDEKIELYIGDAFDVVGEKKRTSYQRTSDLITETYEVRLRNHKKEAVKVHAVDHLFGDWSITEKSHGFEKTDAHTVDFEVNVPAKGETVVTYTVNIKRN